MNKGQVEKELNKLSSDYTAQVIAAEIVDNGIDSDLVYFRNISTFQRFISKDVEDISWNTDDYHSEKLVFDLNREGLYDMLPDGLVHPPVSASTGEETLEVMEQHRLREQSARRFFGVFENEFHHVALRMELVERELFNNKNVFANRALFESLYGNSDHLNDKQVLMLMYLLPLTNKIRGDVELLSIVLSKILDYKIAVERKTKKIKYVLPGDAFAKVGSTVLGVDSVLGGQCEVASFYYDVNIHNVSPEDYASFIVKGKNNNVINFLLPYLFPANADINVVLLSEEANKFLKTSVGDALCFLDFNSYI